LRDQTTKPAAFRSLAHQLTLLLALEATRDLATRPHAVTTPLESHTGCVLAQPLARRYYCKLPPLTGRRVIVVDPMLATGGSAVQALTIVKQHDATDVRLVCIVSAPEGVAAVTAAHPDVPILTAAHDRQLNAKKYILPGLGDFGDRLYGT